MTETSDETLSSMWPLGDNNFPYSCYYIETYFEEFCECHRFFVNVDKRIPLVNGKVMKRSQGNLAIPLHYSTMNHIVKANCVIMCYALFMAF